MHLYRASSRNVLEFKEYWSGVTFIEYAMYNNNNYPLKHGINRDRLKILKLFSSTFFLNGSVNHCNFVNIILFISHFYYYKNLVINMIDKFIRFKYAKVGLHSFCNTLLGSKIILVK